MARQMRPWVKIHDAIEATAVSEFIDCRGWDAIALRVTFSAAKNWTFSLLGSMAYDGAFIPVYIDGVALSKQISSDAILFYRGIPDYLQVKANEDEDGAAVTVWAAPCNL